MYAYIRHRAPKGTKWSVSKVSRQYWTLFILHWILNVIGVPTPPAQNSHPITIRSQIVPREKNAPNRQLPLPLVPLLPSGTKFWYF